MPSEAATLESITIDGKRFSKFAVPSGYELTQPGLNPGDNIILQNGATLYNLQTDGLAGWDSAALQAFQSLNLNYYFTSFSNGEETCGNYPAVATTTAVQHTLLYDPPLPVNAGGFAAVTERNSNNCYHLAVFGLPPGAASGSPEVLLGETFVRPWPGQSGPRSPTIPPGSGQDYWLTERVNDNNGTIGIAIFKLEDLAPTGSQIFRVRLTASTNDPGDGKFLVMQSYALSDSEAMLIEDPPLVADASANDNAPAGSIYTVVSRPQHGELTLDPSGSYVYTPEIGFVGVDSFRYQVCLPEPNQSVCDEAEAVITVSPRTRADAAEGMTGQAADIAVLANDPPFIGLGDIKLLNASGAEVLSLSVLNQGTWTVSGGGNRIIFTPVLGYFGSPTPVRYVATHTASGLKSNAATVTITYPTTAAIGNRVWLDVNANGVQDAGETGQNGVTVQLRNALGSVIASAVTANNPQTGEPGFYRFTGLSTGTYSVRFVLPNGYVISPRSGSISVGSNSDADPATGLTASVSVVPGNSFNYVDAGLVRVVKNGSLTLLKSAEWFQSAQNIARINLKIDATMPLITRDVVLVLDVSGSMNNDVPSAGKSRLTLMKEAASDFATQFLAPHFQGRHRLSVVTFSNDANVNLTLTSHLPSVLNTLSGLVTAGGTNTQGGIEAGTGVLDNAPDFPGGLGQAEEKMLLVLADGQANRANKVLTTASVDQEDRDSFYFPATYPDGSAVSIKATAFEAGVQGANSQDSAWRTVSQALLSKRKGYKLYGVAFGRESEIGTLATWTMRHVASQASNYYNTVDSPGNIFNEILQNILSAGNNAAVADVMGFGDGYQWQLITGQPSYPIQTTPSSGFTLSSQNHGGRSIGVINWTPGNLRAGTYELSYFVRLQATKLLANIAGNSPPLPTNYQAQLSYNRLDGQLENVLFPSPALTVPIRSVSLSKTDHLGQPVTGAGFTLYGDAAGTLPLAPEQMLPGSGPATLFTGLVRGHTYFMRETTVPTAYIDENHLYRVIASDSLAPSLALFNPTTQSYDPLTNPVIINRARAVAVADTSLDNPPGQPLIVGVTLNDIPGGYPLDPQSVVLVNPPPGSTLSPDRRTLTVPGEGVWSVNTAMGTVTFTPEIRFWGPTKPVFYTISDTRGYPSLPAPVNASVRPFLGIGNLVFFDANDNGRHDPGEGRANVPLQLYRADQTPGIDRPIAATVSAANGTYLFDQLDAGIYIVHVPASAFQAGGSLVGMSVIAEGLSGDDDVGQNGRQESIPEMDGVSSGSIALFFGSAPTQQSGETGFQATLDNEIDAAVDLTVDFGFQLPMMVGNRVFIDKNLNGRYDEDDDDEGDDDEGEGVAAVQIDLYRADADPATDLPLYSVATDVDGLFLFTGLMPGQYRLHIPRQMFDRGAPLYQLESITGTRSGDDDVGEDGIDDPLPQRNGISTAIVHLQRGVQPTDQTTETGSDNTLDNSNDANGNLTLDFGFRSLDPLKVGVGNLVFIDLNGNNKADLGEGASGVTVQLFNEGNDPQTNTPLASTLTNAEGVYLFRGLLEGAYFIHIPASEFALGQPLDGMRSIPGAGADWGLDDDFDENGLDSPNPWVTGISSTRVYLAPNTEPENAWGESGLQFDVDDADDNNTDLTVDLGFTVPVAVGNLVFLDANSNGRADPGEGVPGVTVQLFTALAQPLFDAPIAETTTDAQGRYLFVDLGAGDYMLHIPAWMFASGAPLANRISLPGTTTGDDNTSEDGIDNPQATAFGISSGTVSLYPGLAPAGSAESGFDAASDDASDTHTDLTLDFGFSIPATLGGLVFHDLNGDGLHQPNGADGQPFTADDEPVLPVVPVEIWHTGSDRLLGGGDDLLIDTLETQFDGSYLREGLSTGTYYVRIPEGAFAPSGALAGLPVISPVRSALDNQIPGDNNGAQPGGRATAALSPVIALAPEEVDTTVGFGFMATVHPLTWPAWQLRNGSLADTTFAGNPDGDAYSNLLEFAFGLDSKTGVAPRPPVRIEVDPATQRIDLCVDRVTGTTGLTFTVQLLSDLATSPGGWVEAQGLTPVITQRPNQTEEVRYQDIASHPAVVGSQGFARLVLSLDADLNGEPEAVQRSETVGWSRLTLGTHLQTLGHSFAPTSRFTALVGAVNGTALDVTAALNGATPASLLTQGAEHYVEILSGAHAGHRLELNESATATALGSLVLDTAHLRNTLNGGAPDTLVGARIALRQHLTLGEIADRTRFAATNNATTADRVMLFDPATSAFQSYWLFHFGGNPRWVRQGDGSLANQGSLVIAPGLGLFVQPRTRPVTVILRGLVRDHAFARPLVRGPSLCATGWPMTLTPNTANMTAAAGFTGATSATQADQIQNWTGDIQPGTQNYTGLFLLRLGTRNTWSNIGDSSLANQNNTPCLRAHRAFFLRTRNAIPNWITPRPWTPW